MNFEFRRRAMDRFEELRLKLPWPLADKTRINDYFFQSCCCGHCVFAREDMLRADRLFGPHSEALFKVWAYQREKPLSPDET